MIGTNAAGTAMRCHIVTAIRNGVVKSDNLIFLKENGGLSQLMEHWVRGVLKSLNCLKRKSEQGKQSCPNNSIRKKVNQKKISGAIFYHDIPEELIVNLDQTPLSYVNPGKYSFGIKDVKTISIKCINNKYQITSTFAISMLFQSYL